MKEVPKDEWADFLLRIAASNQGSMVDLYQEKENKRELLGSMPLIAFEGDCTGDVVTGVKVVIGDMGVDNPENLFHYINAPSSISVVEDGIREIQIVSKDNEKTILRFI